MIEKLRKTWKPMPVTVILGVLAAYYFGITGAFWAVTGEFTRWGASLMKMCGVDISKYSYLKLIHYKGTILTRVDGVMILGMFLGMFIAAALSNNIKFRVPQSMVRVFQAIIGGIIAGFGARLAFGRILYRNSTIFIPCMDICNLYGMWNLCRNKDNKFATFPN